jgi:tetratricopeptide (TPR) repeat protein
MKTVWLQILIGVAGVGLLGTFANAQDADQTDPPAEVAPVVDEAQLQKACDDAYDHYMTGQYLASIKLYGEVLKDAPDHVVAAVGKARAEQAIGRYAESLETLDACEATDHARWYLTRVEALKATGEYESALEAAKVAYDLEPLWSPAAREYGQLLEMFGKNDDALEVFEQVQTIISEVDYTDDAEQLVAIGEILETYSEMKGLRASEQANNIFNNYFQVAYQDVDAGYYPAHVAAGWFAIDKHRYQIATNEFNAALLTNPNIPEAKLGLAVIALTQWDFEGALEYVREALKINSELAEAHAIRAVCLMQWRRNRQAAVAIEKGLTRNPNHVDLLSLAAAMAIRDRDPDAAQPYIEKVHAMDPQCETLPLAIAEWLSAGRQYTDAKGYYQQAIAMAPTSASAWTGLGQLYMQTGQESDAKEAFEKAHEIDDFRADIVNYLGLLDDMENYSVRETEHFIIKVDGEYDEILLDLIAKEAEIIYRDVCVDFAHEPEEKTIIEFFPDHTDFSVRLTGRGWLPTVGASTGRVIIMVTPHETRGDFGTYNWVNVLRHEFAHTVTLSATDNRIPHWFTEACAVWQQPDRQSFDAVRQLTDAVREDRLFPIHELDWGFVRPRRAGDRSLAYAQSEWILEYIIETQGYEKVGEMLEAFRAGKTQTQVFSEVLGVTEHGFNQAFKRWARDEVEAWGFDTVPTGELGNIAAAVRVRPNDADLQATYASVLYREGNFQGAKDAATQAVALDPRNLKALEVLALVGLAEEEYATALAYAEQVLLIDPDSAVATRVMAEVFIEERQWAGAIVALEQYQQSRPMDPFSYEKLASVYRQLGQPEKELPNLIELHQGSMMDPEYARRIADIYNAAREEELARHYYEQVTHIDPFEIGAHEALAAIHRNAKRYDEAIASVGRLVMLEDSAESWAKLAMVRFVAGRNTDDLARVYQARAEAEHSVELDADGDGGKVLRQIQKYLDEKDPDGAMAPTPEETDDRPGQTPDEETTAPTPIDTEGDDGDEGE